MHAEQQVETIRLWRESGYAQTNIPHVVRHSPTGIEWGYGGSGPADLALSVLTYVVGADRAERHYHDFKWEVVAGLPFDGGELDVDSIRVWVENREAAS